MLILNTGGTFNKRYNPLSGDMEVPFDNSVVDKILQNVDDDYDFSGVMYKDSLDMTINDRKMLVNIIMESKDDKFIVIHGTDTMSETAEFFDTIFEDRKIILVGAMRPFEIDNIEASLNLGMAIGYLRACEKNGVYICMSGFTQPWNKLRKNTKFGKFQLVR